MSPIESATEFCRAIMHDYERQWTLAQGHAQRHPLRIKIHQLEVLMSRSLTDEEFSQVIQDGQRGDDWELGLLCADLEPRWQAARLGEPYFTT
jgi:hypothetical protein